MKLLPCPGFECRDGSHAQEEEAHRRAPPKAKPPGGGGGQRQSDRHVPRGGRGGVPQPLGGAKRRDRLADVFRALGSLRWRGPSNALGRRTAGRHGPRKATEIRSMLRGALKQMHRAFVHGRYALVASPLPFLCQSLPGSSVVVLAGHDRHTVDGHLWTRQEKRYRVGPSGNEEVRLSLLRDGHQGKQNGGLKENSSAPDSKGPRRRRRSTSLQPATSDVKEDSDAVGEDKTRRRRRSRGANRRKCRGGGESDVSGNEQKRASEDRDVSDTDVRKKGSRRSSRNRKSCSVDRIKSDAEDKPKKQEQDAVAPKKTRRRRSRTDKPEAEAKIRFAIHGDAEQKMEVVVPMVDEAQKEVLAVRETAKTELSAPVVTDNVQMEVPITFDEVQTTEVPVTVDGYQMEEVVSVDEIQTEVRVTVGKIETEVPNAMDQEPITMDTYQLKEPVTEDEIETEVPIATGDAQTEVPIATNDVQTEVSIATNDVQTEVSIATNDVQTEVPIATNDVQTEVPIATNDVQTEVSIVTNDVQTEVPIATNDVQTEVSIATNDVQTEVPIATNDVQTEVSIVTNDVQTEVPIATNESSHLNGDGLDKHSVGAESPLAEDEMVEGDENQELAESNVHMRENVAEDVATTESVIDDQLPMQLLNENAIELELQETSDVAGSPDDGSSEREEDERCLSQSSCAKENEEHECITVEVHRVEEHRSKSETCEVGMEDIVSPECQKNSEAMLVSSELSNGDFNKETEVVKIENSYSEGAFFINVIESNDQCRAMDTDEVWEEVEEMSDAEVFYDASDRCVANLSAEERELLDPSPVMEAAEEETLRRFIHSLNLADYSKEAVTGRNGGAEELFASRRDKRRTSLETYQSGYTQQRGLEVIVEENSSDYSDGEARKSRGWQEAVFIPETNEVVFVNNDDESSSSGQDSSSSRNSALFYPSRLKATEGIDVFSEDMENALENAVRVELADSSDEDVEVVEGSWERGVATERQDGVEIVFLDEDSGSTSSGFKQDDPEDFGKRDSGDFSDSSGVYENVEFVNQRMTVLRKKDYRRSVIESEDTCAVYENVVFVRRDVLQSNACPSSEERIIDDMQENDKLTKENQNEIDVIGTVKESVDDTILVKENEKSPESTIPKENYNEADKSNTIKEMVDKGIVDNTISAKENEKSPEYAITKENKNKTDKINTVEELVEKKVVDYTDSAKENEKLTESTITKETQNKSDEIYMVKEIVYDAISAKENGKSPESTIKKENQNETDKINTVKEIVENRIVDDTISSEEIEKLTESTITNETQNKSDEIYMVKEKIIVDDIYSAKENEKLPKSTIKNKNRNEIDNVDTFKEVIVKRIDNIASVQQVNNSQESIIIKENKNETDKIDVINKKNVEVHEHDKLSECSVTNQSQNANELLSVEEKEVSGYFISVDAIEKDAASDSQSKHEDLDLESITPTNRSRRGSSSSDAGSHGTAFYCPGGFSPVSSDADVSSVTEDVENRTLRRRHLPKRQQEAKKCIPVRSLKELCVERVVSLPCGGDILRMLGLGKPPMPDPGGVDRQQPKPDPLWLGVPTKQDPNLLVCLSPSQRQSYGQGEAHTTPDNLLDLHRKFVARRGYHESAPAPPPRGRHCTTSTSSQDSEIGVAGVEGKGVSCSRSRSSSRLLALLRADLSPPSSASSESSSVASSPPPLPPPPHAYAMLHRRPSTICCTPNDLHTATLITNDDERLKVRSLSDWLQLVRCGGSPPVSACISTQSSPGSVRRAKDPRPASEQNGLKEHQILKQQILERRFSLPEKAPVLPTSAREDERHDQQLKLLHQRQQQRLRNQQQQQKPPLPKQQKLFDPDNYTISRRGDVAVINNGRPKSMPPGAESLVTGGELFRQQMYNEYMHKVAERAERRRQKVIRLSTAVAPPPRDTDAAPEALEAAVKLENEFMGKVRARMDKLGLKYDEDDEDSEGDGGHQLPKHLQEFLVIAGDSDSDGESAH
ncbi:hypothetical protein C0J52_04938 [Blattella germanica]|nr:hypothetical protein C0J52_04938 [Blattella germanica]